MSKIANVTVNLTRLTHRTRRGQAVAVALCSSLWIVVLTCSATSSMAGNDETLSGSPARNVTNYSESAHYVELELDHKVKPSALKPGDVLAGRLSRDVYSGEREVFPAGTPVQLTVGKLERRKKAPDDHWPGVVKLFAPRHENYPTFESATVSLAGGGQVALRVSLISIIHKSELRPASKKLQSSAGRNITKQQRSAPGQTVILEATGLTPDVISTLPLAQPATGVASQTGRVKLDTGTRAQVVLLRSLSASKNRPGDSFLARLVEPVRLGSRIVLPEGSLLEGRIVKATPPRWLSRPGLLNLMFTGLRMPQGASGPIAATLVGAEVDSGSHTRLDSEGSLSGSRPGKAWMLINLGVTAGLAKETDDGIQLLIEALVSTATDASTAGVARIVAACTSGIFMVTRRGRDVVLPRFTEMDITFNRPFLPPEAKESSRAESGTGSDAADRVPSK
jgi:hypothetical protein